MKTIVLFFNGSPAEDINIFLSVISSIKETNHPSTSWNIVASRPILNRIERIKGIGYIDYDHFIRSRFPHVFHCSSLLKGVDEKKKVEIVTGFLLGRIGGKIAPSISKISITTKKVDLVLEGVCDPCDGYGASTHSLIKEYIKTRKGIGFFPRFYGESSSLIDPAVKASIVDNPISSSYLIYLALYDNLLNNIVSNNGILKGPNRSQNSKKILMTMFESNKLPSTWAKRAKAFDKIIVPCSFCEEIFKESINVPVFRIPLGIDIDLFSFVDRVPSVMRPFRFLILYANHPLFDDRKNALLGVKAFIELFANNKDVELIVKLSGDPGGDLSKNWPSNIRIINDRSTTQEVVNLYHECDALLFPSKGEGYGLPPREAMATGMPVIITNYSGLTDIASPDKTFPIEIDGLSPANYVPWIYEQHNNGSSFIGNWASVDYESLLSQMRYVYLNQDKAFDIGRKGAEYIRENESISKTAQLIYDACI